EIENAAMCTEGADKVCCIYNNKRQVIVLLAEGEVTEDSLISEIKKHVPEYMVPGKVVLLDKMPMNANGKTDRNLLNETYGN
ncbi:MAG: D-alanine--poly(phosphoribitol) ligase, partial [Lachnospiraceae bacterium]|nr:D-alanine--poly(phosphoribitol) ligase [Lachnospiraceae bacterium]